MTRSSTASQYSTAWLVIALQCSAFSRINVWTAIPSSSRMEVSFHRCPCTSCRSGSFLNQVTRDSDRSSGTTRSPLEAMRSTGTSRNKRQIPSNGPRGALDNFPANWPLFADSTKVLPKELAGSSWKAWQAPKFMSMFKPQPQGHQTMGAPYHPIRLKNGWLTVRSSPFTSFTHQKYSWSAVPLPSFEAGSSEASPHPPWSTSACEKRQRRKGHLLQRFAVASRLGLQRLHWRLVRRIDGNILSGRWRNENRITWIRLRGNQEIYDSTTKHDVFNEIWPWCLGPVLGLLPKQSVNIWFCFCLKIGYPPNPLADHDVPW